MILNTFSFDFTMILLMSHEVFVPAFVFNVGFDVVDL